MLVYVYTYIVSILTLFYASTECLPFNCQINCDTYQVRNLLYFNIVFVKKSRNLTIGYERSDSIKNEGILTKFKKKFFKTFNSTIT